MEWISKLKINQKLNVLIILGAAFLVIVGFTGYWFLNKSNNEMKDLYDNRVLPIVWFSKIKHNVSAVDADLLKLSIRRDKTIYEDLLKRRKENNELLTKYEATKLDPFEKEQIAEYKNTIENYRTIQKNTLSLALANKGNDARNYYMANLKDVKKLESILESLSDYNAKVAQEIKESTDQNAKLACIILLVTNISALILLITAGTMISNMITRPIKKAIDGLNIETEELSAASSQVSAASQTLAEGVSEQAASIQETSSTLEETSSMVHQNRENTQQAASLAKQAKKYAEQSNTEMEKMAESMTSLKSSSNEIAKIIKVIDEIAFQTNLLSLNAAVEAARAGDAGKGFAVVAEEVRNLAQRSAQAAKDTTVIIESNIELSETSVNIAKTVKESVASIEDEARKVSDLLEEIAVATNEQAQGVEQINKAVSQMEIALQANASTADESAAASQALQEQAINVRDIVDSLIVLVDGAETLEAKNRELKIRSQKTISATRQIPKRTTKVAIQTQRPETVIPLHEF